MNRPIKIWLCESDIFTVGEACSNQWMFVLKRWTSDFTNKTHLLFLFSPVFLIQPKFFLCHLLWKGTLFPTLSCRHSLVETCSCRLITLVSMFPKFCFSFCFSLTGDEEKKYRRRWQLNWDLSLNTLTQFDTRLSSAPFLSYEPSVSPVLIPKLLHVQQTTTRNKQALHENERARKRVCVLLRARLCTSAWVNEHWVCVCVCVALFTAARARNNCSKKKRRNCPGLCFLKNSAHLVC